MQQDLKATKYRNNIIGAEIAYNKYKMMSIYRLNKLSATILSELLQDINYDILFPFKSGDYSVVNVHSDVIGKKPITIPNGKGYRITNSAIYDLNIYLNRIKQKYKKNKEFGECIDLVIGSTIKNEVYNHKHSQYLYSDGGGFTLQELYDELVHIKEHSETDKGVKRQIRMDFLRHMLESPHKDIYEIILKACYDEIMPPIDTSPSTLYNNGSGGGIRNPLIPNRPTGITKKRKPSNNRNGKHNGNNGNNGKTRRRTVKPKVTK